MKKVVWVTVLSYVPISIAWIVIVTLVQSKVVLALTPLVILMAALAGNYFLNRSFEKKVSGR